MALRGTRVPLIAMLVVGCGATRPLPQELPTSAGTSGAVPPDTGPAAATAAEDADSEADAPTPSSSLLVEGSEPIPDGTSSAPSPEAPKDAPACAALSSAPQEPLLTTPFSDIARAAVPSYDAVSGLAAVAKGRVRDCRGHTASAISGHWVREDPVGGRQYVEGRLHDGGRFELADGRVVSRIATCAESLGVEGRAAGFLAIVRRDNEWIVVDAITPTAHTTLDGPIESLTLRGQNLLLESRLVSFADDNSTYEDVVWVERNHSLLAAGRYRTVDVRAYDARRSCARCATLYANAEATDHLVIHQRVRFHGCYGDTDCSDEIRIDGGTRHFDLVRDKLVERRPAWPDAPLQRFRPPP